MKQVSLSLLPLIIFFFLLFAYTKVVGPIPFSVNNITTNKTDSFSVTGEGKVSIKPDMAIVNLGIQANGSTVSEVQNQVNSIIKQVSSSIKKLGVDEKDIKTTSYNINPTYNYQNSAQKISGFSANTNLEIKVKEIERLNNIIDTATTNGANQVGGIYFDIADKTKSEGLARQQAVAEAKKKAIEAAKIAGFSLGKIINYSENFGGTPIPVTFASRGVGNINDEKSTQIEPGSSEIKVIVTLSYEVR